MAAPSRFVALAPTITLAVVAVVYVWLAPVWIFGGDNAEYAAIGAGGGVAHPPGYPLYTMYLQAMQWLPGSTPAHTAALATALLGVASIAVLYRACVAWGASPLAALVATGVFAGGPLPLVYYTEAEVFALNGLFVAMILWFTAVDGPARGLGRIAVLGLVGGLAASHHPSAGLVFPVGFVGIARGLRELERRRWRGVVVGVGAFVLGLAPILLMLTQGHGVLVWRDVHDLGSLGDQVLRRDYGVFGSGGFAHVDLTDTWGLFVRSIVASLRWIGVVPLVLGFARGVSRPIGRETRAAWIALAVAVVLAGPAFVARIELPTSGFGKDILERFHILPLLLLVPATAIGIDLVGARLAARWKPRPSVLALAAIVTFPIAAILSSERTSAQHSAAFERYVENTLHSLPAGSILIGTQDSLVFGAAYVQRVLGVRPDVVHIDTNMVFTNAEFRRHVIAQLGFDPAPGATSDIAPLAREALARGRAVFLDVARVRALLGPMPAYPFGTTMRIVKPRDLLPLDIVERIDRDLLDQFVMDYPVPGPTDGWHTAAEHHYAVTWIVLADLYRQIGRDADAERCDAQAAMFEPH